MDRRRVWRECKRGLAETKPYLLSHHEPHEYYRCHTVSRRHDIHLCARCTGIYPAIVLGVVTAWVGVVPSPLLVISLFGLPSLVDWLATSVGPYRGYNSVRTLTGGLLGFAYGVGLVELLFGQDLRVLAVGLGYGLLAGLLLLTVDRTEQTGTHGDA